uniref:GPALPP motifs-containing protein 1 n=1 Tax=Talaromyces marneffei PM1 TaxID=1077442 RepID=A0A093V0S0_TALMA
MGEKDVKHPGPSLPLPSERTRSPPATTDDESVAPEASKIVGPSRPPTQTKSESKQEPQESDDSSDDDFGPQLPPVGGTKSSPSKYEVESRPTPRINDGDTDNLATKKRQRDDWMLNPPENSSWASGPNPAALTNRKFMSGKSARGTRSTDGAGSVWTEDPAQKRQRLENEVLGIKSESSARSARSRDLSYRTNSSTADKLKSLTDIQKPKEDDPSRRAFDYEKDVAGKTSISSGARRKLLNQASDYTSRFSGGKYI